MISTKDESGYTLIEVLVSLTLVLVLLYIFNQILPTLIFQNSDGSKLLAINAAKNTLENTIIEQDYRDFSVEINKNLVLKQSISKKDYYIHIQISVSNKSKKLSLHTLQAYLYREE